MEKADVPALRSRIGRAASNYEINFMSEAEHNDANREAIVNAVFTPLVERSQLERDWDNPEVFLSVDEMVLLIATLRTERNQALSDLSQREQQLRTALSERDEAKRIIESYGQWSEEEDMREDTLTKQLETLTAALKTAREFLEIAWRNLADSGQKVKVLKNQGLTQESIDSYYKIEVGRMREQALAVLDKLEVKG